VKGDRAREDRPVREFIYAPQTVFSSREGTVNAMIQTPERTLEKLYKPSARTPEIVDVPEMHFLTVDGAGDPNTSRSYEEAVGALYALSYTLKFALKRTGFEYKVSPLEGLWWADDMARFNSEHREHWRWTMMIAQPPQVTRAWVQTALEDVRRKKNPPGLERVRFEVFHEGRAAQIMHVGPYATEGPNILKLHAFIRERGGHFDGRTQKHHEIYFSDPNRTAPEKIKTIIRQPFKTA
jgi:hypothetical protein